MQTIKPKKLKQGDSIGIIAPSSSACLISKDNLLMAKNNLESLGFKVVYGENIFKNSELPFDDIKWRIDDLHKMFASKEIKGIMAVIGGHSSNELLPHINYEIIKENPKVFIGFSDITALQNAILKMTSLITFSGPCFANFAQTNPPFDFEERYFKEILMEKDEINLEPSDFLAEDEWWKEPKKQRELKNNKGWTVINTGFGMGTIIGGNLSTFLLLSETQYMPDLDGKILFIEEDPKFNKGMIKRMLVQISQNKNFDKIKGLVVGRFGSKSNLQPDEEICLLKEITNNLNIPVISSVDFGHTNPMITFPIGGACEINTSKNLIKLKY